MPARNTPQKFWALVDKGAPDDCWLWTGSKAGNGYGQVEMARNVYAAHRLAWELTNGEIPGGRFVCHRCDNPLCCNPAHLFLGTHADNMNDMKQKGRGSGWSVPILRGEAHPSHKLTEDDVKAIRAIEGMTQKGIGRLYGISQATVSSIVRREYWPHVF